MIFLVYMHILKIDQNDIFSELMLTSWYSIYTSYESYDQNTRNKKMTYRILIKKVKKNTVKKYLT